MSEKEVGRTIHYSYPKDCGKFVLFPNEEIPDSKPIDKMKYKCSWTSQWSYGGHLDIFDADSNEKENDDEEEEEEENFNSCELSMDLYNNEKWHVYYTELGCGWYNIRLLGLFDHYEGAEIFTRILSDRNNEGAGIYHKGERISIDVKYEDDEKEEIGIELYCDDGEGFGTYLWIVSADYPFRITHSLNYADDWDQDCQTDLDIKIPLQKPLLKKNKKKDKKKDRKRDKKSIYEKKPKKTSKK